MVTETLIRSMYAYWRKVMGDPDEQTRRLLLQLEVDQLNAAYAAALDEKRFEDWPEFFLEDGRYTVQARENFDRGLPLALIGLESRA
jgi:salicylate 5-hydroxylase small subunit